MGDAEEKIEYSPEELEEIDRIVSTVLIAEKAPEPTIEEPTNDDSSTDEDDDLMDINFGEPENLDLPESNLDFEAPDDTPADDASLDDLMSIGDETPTALNDESISFDDIETADNIETISADDLTIMDEPSSEVDEISDIPDISDSIEPVDDVPDISDDISFDDSISDPVDDISVDDSSGSLPTEQQPVSDNALDQLNALTANEPESIDLQDISEDSFVDSDFSDPGLSGDQDISMDISSSDLGELDDIDDVPDLALDDQQPSDEVSLSTDDDTDIPDLSDIGDLGDADSIPEAVDDDIPDIDINDMGGDTDTEISMDTGDMSLDSDMGDPTSTEPTDSSNGSLDEIDDIPDLGDIDLDAGDIDTGGIDSIDAEPTTSDQEVAMNLSTDELSSGDDLSDDLAIEPIDDDLGDIDTSIDDDIPVAAGAAGVAAVGVGAAATSKGGDDELEISDKDLKKLKTAIILFNPAVRNEIKNAVINDQLNPADTKQLVSMIISGKSEDSIHKFLEKKLNKKISLIDEAAPGRRRVITQRPEYGLEGRERQKRLLKLTKIVGLSALGTILIIGLLYFLYFRPKRYKNYINDGRALILKTGNELKNFKDAEENYKKVSEDYLKNMYLAFFKEKIYLYATNEYGRAYFVKKEYIRSINKFKEGYDFNFKANKRVNIETLLNLGKYFAKVPKGTYRRNLKDNVNRWFYHSKKDSLSEKTQLQVAIYLYKRALMQEPDNIRALYGIGNAYSHQGQYLKAERYFKDILKVNKKSIVGYSGLLNLYIERDVFPLVSQTHTDLRYKNLLKKSPEPLLAKLASYYLDKLRTPKQNLRVDFGIISPKILDKNDNPFPAIKSALNALNQKNPKYPPLYLQAARLARVQKNYKIMKVNLERALEYSKSEYSSANFFGALNLMGQYYYYVKNPIKAYNYLNKAVKAYGYQPNFVHEEFYKETEKIGETYATMGNIFYYFFEKTKMRFGDIDDDSLTKNLDRLASYSISRKKYEKAIESGFKSSELHYNLGRIYYLQKQYTKALDSWIKLYDDFVKHPDIMYALGNAYYHTKRYEAAKGEFLRMISMYEHNADQITMVRSSNPDHDRIFSSLASAYNNLGAIYQLQNNESKSHISYWKAIEHSKRINRENEFARVNLARGFRKRKKPVDPILDENIPFSIDKYREK